MNERTYDWLYCRDQVLGPEGYLIQEIPFADGDSETEWVRLIHERTFTDLARHETYVRHLLRRYENTYGGPVAPLQVLTSHPDAEPSPV